MNTNNNSRRSNIPVLHDEIGSNQIAVHDPYANAYIPEGEIDLRDIWKVISKHKGLIFTVVSLVLITTVIATLLMRPVYRAQSLIVIKPHATSKIKTSTIEQEDFFYSHDYKKTQQNILLSGSVAKAVIEKLQLQNNPEINGDLYQRGFVTGINDIIRGITKSFVTKDTSQGFEGAFDESVAQVQRFRSRLRVFPVEKSDLFNITFDSFDPKLSADAVNTAVAEYMRLDRLRRLNSTSDAKKFLKAEIASIQAKLESSEKDLTDFARKNNIVDVEEKGNIMTQRLSDLNAQLTEITSARVAAEASWSQASSGIGLNVLPAVLENPLINQLKLTQSELQGEYLKLSKIYKSEYPKLKQLKAQLDDTNEGLNREISRIAGGIKSSYEQLLNRERLITGKVEEQKQALLAIKDKSVQYNILKREWESNKELYTGLLDTMKEVGVSGGMEPNNIAVIDLANVPGGPYKPNLLLNAALAGVLGLMGGLGIAFLLSFLDNTVRTPEDLEKAVGLPSLGLVPIESKATQKKRKKQTIASDADTTSRYQSMLEFKSHYERKSDVAEAFRSIRTSLMFSSPSGLPKVIQVTSTIPGEGKTTLASNLALVLADNGAKVLLMDADLRKHRLHKVFGVPSSPGLSEAIISGTDQDFVINVPIDNLYLLPAGTTPPNPAELIGSQNMLKFIERLGETYDHIVLDSAPLLGLADSVVLSTKVDGVIYAVNSGLVNKDNLREGVKRLRRVNAPLLGAILNNVDMNSKEYGYYGEYYYSYQGEEANS